MGNYRHLEINDDVRAEVSNPNLDVKEMEYCVLSSQTELRELVASNPKLLAHFARWMSKDVDHTVRAALSQNTSIDPTVIFELSNDSHLAVISAASENPNLNQPRLAELADNRPPCGLPFVALDRSPPLVLLCAPSGTAPCVQGLGSFRAD